MVPRLWIESKRVEAAAAAVWVDVCRPALSVWQSVFVFFKDCLFKLGEKKYIKTTSLKQPCVRKENCVGQKNNIPNESFCF